MKELADNHPPEGETIVVVQDNMNTHSAGSFYKTFNAPTDWRLAKKFEFHYTPKKASWLNMEEKDIIMLLEIEWLL